MTTTNPVSSDPLNAIDIMNTHPNDPSGDGPVSVIPNFIRGLYQLLSSYVKELPGVFLGPDPRIGQYVMVRAHAAGIYFGRLEGFDGGDKRCPILAPGNRQLHYWARGGSVHNICEKGLVGGDHRVTTPASSRLFFELGAEVSQIIVVKKSVVDSFITEPIWNTGIDEDLTP